MLKSNCNCKWGGCACSKAGKILLFIGGLNWGLVGLGMLMGTDLNVIHMILGAWPIIEGIVYVLVGVAAVMKIFAADVKSAWMHAPLAHVLWVLVKEKWNLACNVVFTRL